MGKQQAKKNKDERLAANKKRKAEEQKKQTAKAVIVTLTAIILAAALIAGGIFTARAIGNAYADSGKSYRKLEVYKTTHFKADAAMLSFCFYEYLSQYSVLGQMNVKTPEDLKGLTFESGGKETYYQYYSELTASQLEKAMLFAEAAVASGLSLEEKDNARIEAKLSAIENAAMLAGKKTKDYIFENYGRGVKISDIRKVYEIRALSDKNLDAVYNAQTVSEKEIQQYISENDDLKYYRVDYYIFDFVIGNLSNNEENKKRHDECYAKAQKLAECKTAEEFETLARQYLQEEYKDDPDFTDADLEALMRSMKVEKRAIDKNSKSTVDQWIFDFSRKTGETMAVDGEKSVGTVFMIKPAYSVDEPQKAVRVISIRNSNYARPSEANTAMKEIEKQYEAGAKTEEAFSALAREWSEDGLTAPLGGYTAETYSETTFNQMIASWLEEAKPGETMSFTSEEGRYFVYFCGNGETRSVIEAQNALKSNKYKAVINGYYALYAPEAHLEYVGTVAPLKAD